MNIFEEFSVAREVDMAPGEMALNKQRTLLFPLSFISSYVIKVKDDPERARELYESMKKGMMEFSISLGKEYKLAFRDFLDRWVKYCAFSGWGLVKYQLLDQNGIRGFMYIKDLPLHLDLKSRGIKEPADVLFEGLIAGSASGTFNADIDVIEVDCVCSGSAACVYYWGSKEELSKKFPEIALKRFGALR